MRAGIGVRKQAIQPSSQGLLIKFPPTVEISHGQVSGMPNAASLVYHALSGRIPMALDWVFSPMLGSAYGDSSPFLLELSVGYLFSQTRPPPIHPLHCMHCREDINQDVLFV